MESAEKDYSTLGSVAALIEQTLHHYQCEPAALFLRAGIDIERINDPAARFPVTRMQKLWRYAVDETGDPCFGLTAGELLQPAALHGLGLAWLASDTLCDGLARLTRFSRLISTACPMQIQNSHASTTSPSWTTSPASGHDSIAMRVRATIIERLPDGTPSQGNIAEILHVSMRSLQRRLNNENTNFKELLEGTRHELALQYIQEQHRTIGEITYLLGFSEPSNFSRAFRRWTGMSPAEYRESA